MKKKIIYNNQETHYSVTNEGKVFNDKTNRELKGTVARNEYHSVQLTIEGKPKTFMVHRLVAEAFCDNPNNYTIVDHIDRNKLNNKASNLRWASKSENALNVESSKKTMVKYFSKEDLEKVEWRALGIDKQYLISKNGDIVNTKTSKYLLGNIRNGYKRVCIKNKYYSVHRLVWETFIDIIPEKIVIDHINGNRADNRLDNLRLVTQSENMKNAQSNGHKSQVSVKQYDKNGNFIKEYRSFAEAMKETGVSSEAIRQATLRHGSSGNFFWIRKDENITIEEILKKNNKTLDNCIKFK